jgi:flagellar motor switch protein FliG
MKGIRKAALILLSLGEEEAVKVLKQIPEHQIEAVVTEMSKIRSVSKEEKTKILKEFYEEAKTIAEEIHGGKNAAQELLHKTFGKEKADFIWKKIENDSQTSPFEFLDTVSPNIIFQLLQGENLQIIAVILSHLEPKIAAAIMKLFPSDQQSKIALKLATTSKTHPDALNELAKAFKRKLDQKTVTEYTEAGGTQTLANILNFMDKTIEDGILKDLESSEPDLASQVREKLYSFEDILSLDKKEIRILLQELNSDEILSVSLKGAGDLIRTHVFSALSQNRVQDILDSESAKGKVTLKEINDARSKIVTLARKLEEKGRIIFKKNDEEYI